MKLIILIIMIICPLFAGATEDEDKDLLKTIDKLLTPPDDVVTEIRITTFKETTSLSEKVFTHFRDRETDQFLLICSLPPAWQGFAFVKRKDRIWAYTPLVRTFFSAGKYDLIEGTAVRIEDILYREYNKNYDIHTTIKTEVNREPAIKLTLKAKSETAPYDSIIVWIHEEKKLPLKEEVYDAGSHLLKTIRYSGFREKDGWYQPSKILITDVLGDNTSFIRITKTTLSPIPEYVFTRSFVEFITK